MAYVFLSYAHDDVEFAKKLEGHLEAKGIETWFDQEITRGAHWRRRLQEKIDGCSAFLVVMTPASEQAVWVERELNRAESTSRPIFPLLLSGDAFMRLSELQYEDVRGARMPSEQFTSEVRGYVDLVDGELDQGQASAATLSLDSENEDTFRILKHIYSRAIDPRTTFRVLHFLRQVEKLQTNIEVGRSKRTQDGQSDYVMVRDAGPRLMGAVAYVKPSNGGMTLRLKEDDLSGLLPNDRISVRQVKAADPYGIFCPLKDDRAVEVAVSLTELALRKVRDL